MITFPYRVLQSTQALITLEPSEEGLICQDCERLRPSNKQDGAIYYCELLTRAIYLCEDHYLARKAADEKTADLHHALSRGFSAGNYANAYVNQDFDLAWTAEEEEDRDESDERVFKHAAYKSAFLIGFFGTYEEDEIPSDYFNDWHDAFHTYAPIMQAIGIAVSRDDDDDGDLDVCVKRPEPIPGMMPDAWFRKPDDDTEAESFRQWSRDNYDPKIGKSTLGQYHPLVRDEWAKIAAERGDTIPD